MSKDVKRYRMYVPEYDMKCWMVLSGSYDELEAENARLRDSIRLIDTLPPGNSRITELEAEVEHWQATAQRLKHQLIIDSEEDDDE